MVSSKNSLCTSICMRSNRMILLETLQNGISLTLPRLQLCSIEERVVISHMILTDCQRLYYLYAYIYVMVITISVSDYWVLYSSYLIGNWEPQKGKSKDKTKRYPHKDSVTALAVLKCCLLRNCSVCFVLLLYWWKDSYILWNCVLNDLHKKCLDNPSLLHLKVQIFSLRYKWWFCNDIGRILSLFNNNVLIAGYWDVNFPNSQESKVEDTLAPRNVPVAKE